MLNPNTIIELDYTFSKDELLEIETQVIQKAVLAHDNYAVLSDQLKDPKAYCDRFIQRYDAHKRGFWKIIIEENIIDHQSQ